MMRFFWQCFLWLVLFVPSLHASIESYDFDDETQRIRYQQLAEELRCPKCQNQNLADSDSQIAADLRKELHAQLVAGKSDDAIIDFMRERYGDFVLYKPRLQRNTLVLWAGPLGLVAVVIALLWWSRRKARQGMPASVEVMPDQQVHDAAVMNVIGARWVHLVSLLVMLSVALGSLSLYRHFGAMSALRITELGHAVFSGELSTAEQASQQQALLSDLDAFLAQHPEQEKFLYMRARLLSEGGIWDRAVADYRELVRRFPDQDNLLAEYAQVLYLQAGRQLTPDASAFLQQALQVNADNVTALGLLGMQAFEQQDYAAAAGFWQRLLRLLPPGSPQAETIGAGLARARELGGVAEQAADTADIRLQVQVAIDDVANPRPDETVFVLLRAVNGPRMPLAVVKTTVAGLAGPLTLDTAQSPMRGQIDLSVVGQFEVVARLSRSGQPMALAGDWEVVSESFTRDRLPEQLSLRISHEITR